jgi:ABC-transporter N-terminal
MSSTEDGRFGGSWSSKTNAGFCVLLRALRVAIAKRGVSSEQDIEKRSHRDHEHFNLQDYLTSYIETNQGAGIQRKQVGVTWEDLQVVASGGEDDKVRRLFVAVKQVILVILLSVHTSRRLTVCPRLCSCAFQRPFYFFFQLTYFMKASVLFGLFGDFSLGTHPLAMGTQKRFSISAVLCFTQLTH